MKALINITSYNREHKLVNLLNQLVDFKVKVWDDYSTFNLEYCYKWDNWHMFYKFQENYGKKKAWLKFKRMFDELKNTDYDYFIFLPDDVVLSDDFVSKAIDTWDSIKDENKICLSFQNDNRLKRGCFTGIAPVEKENVLLTGWCDLMFICDKRFLKSVEITEISLDRWKNNELLSSGVGSMISHQMIKKGLNMYHTKEILLEHLDGVSMMNPKERKKNKL